MSKTITPTTTRRRVYLCGFGQSPCDACGRRTFGKLADYVRGACGTYYENLTPLCARCHRRITEAAAESMKGGAR